MSDITMRHILDVLEQPTTTKDGKSGKLWHAKTETAKRLLGRIKTVLDYAIVNEYRTGSSGRAQVTLPDGAKPRPWDATPTPLQLARARGHRWLAMLESGEVKSLRQIAEREKLDLRYIRRMVRLTSLSPYIVEAILDDALPSGSSLFDFSNEVPLLWAEQGGSSSSDPEAI